MTAEAQPSATGRTLAPRTVLADRYAIEEHIRTTALADVYRATDQHSQSAVFIHVIHPGFNVPDWRGANTAAIGAATDLEHDNIAPPLDVELSGEHGFVVTRPVDGLTVTELLARRAGSGSPGFAPRGAIHIILAICDALAAAHDRGVCHGALCGDTVCVADSGDVTVLDFGLGAAMARAAHSDSTQAESPEPPPFLAPEAVATGELDPRGDVFAVGRLLYQLLVGRPLQKGGPRPSDVAHGLPTSVDELIARSVLPQPESRPSSIDDFGQAIREATSAQTSDHPVATATAPGVSSQEPSLAQSLPPGQLAFDQSILADTEEKWLISKGRLDYGPFGMAEVVEQIRRGQILPGNVIVDNHSGERSFVEEHPLLTDLVEQARQLRDDNRRAQAEAVHAKKEKQRGAALYAFIVGGVAILGVVAYLIVSLAGSDDKVVASGIDTVGEGEYKAAIKFHTPDSKKARKRSGSRRASRSSGSEGSDVLDLDLSEGGGSERLDNSVITGVVQRSGSGLGRCLAKNGGGRAEIQFIVKGPTGRVNWVKVNGQQSGGLYSCVNRVMRGMKFPTVDGPRTRAEFEMEL